MEKKKKNSFFLKCSQRFLKSLSWMETASATFSPTCQFLITSLPSNEVREIEKRQPAQGNLTTESSIMFGRWGSAEGTSISLTDTWDECQCTLTERQSEKWTALSEYFIVYVFSSSLKQWWEIKCISQKITINQPSLLPIFASEPSLVSYHLQNPPDTSIY